MSHVKEATFSVCVVWFGGLFVSKHHYLIKSFFFWNAYAIDPLKCFEMVNANCQNPLAILSFAALAAAIAFSCINIHNAKIYSSDELKKKWNRFCITWTRARKNHRKRDSEKNRKKAMNGWENMPQQKRKWAKEANSRWEEMELNQFL